MEQFYQLIRKIEVVPTVMQSIKDITSALTKHPTVLHEHRLIELSPRQHQSHLHAASPPSPFSHRSCNDKMRH